MDLWIDSFIHVNDKWPESGDSSAKVMLMEFFDVVGTLNNEQKEQLLSIKDEVIRKVIVDVFKERADHKKLKNMKSLWKEAGENFKYDTEANPLVSIQHALARLKPFVKNETDLVSFNAIEEKITNLVGKTKELATQVDACFGRGDNVEHLHALNVGIDDVQKDLSNLIGQLGMNKVEPYEIDHSDGLYQEHEYTSIEVPERNSRFEGKGGLPGEFYSLSFMAVSVVNAFLKLCQFLSKNPFLFKTPTTKGEEELIRIEETKVVTLTEELSTISKDIGELAKAHGNDDPFEPKPR